MPAGLDWFRTELARVQKLFEILVAPLTNRVQGPDLTRTVFKILQQASAEHRTLYDQYTRAFVRRIPSGIANAAGP